ncbi:ATP-grasp domain-containing protein [Bacillus sp. Marseille-P3661]|uniref:ATP-grasp domain-containing protein n=1 Tax=Bacillus sp. Marseille-P3661 TaxID=1936234 RepID=UPI000C8566CF|nr:RimK family alpha-L-glutamate ligase [Bacillus sp. Marseille-P3661]
MTNMVCWIIYNGNLTSGKFLDFGTWVDRVAQSRGIHTEIIKNNELIITIEDNKPTIKGPYADHRPDFVIFGDKDIHLARHLEQMNIKVYNSSDSIEICDNKALTYQKLMDHGISMPKTIIAPKIFDGLNVVDFSPYNYIAEEIGFPLVIKEVFGSFGQQVYLIHDYEELLQKVKELGSIPFVFQELIKSSYGKDIRLNVVGDRVVTAMLRTSDNDFRANVSNGGVMQPYNPTQTEIDLAIKCSQIIGTDFAGIDLLFGEDDQPIVCEVNSNAHIRNIYDCTGVDVAEFMIDYILNDLKY